MNRHFILVSLLALVGCFLLIGTIVLGLIALVRPEWVDYTFRGTSLDESKIDGYSRLRGMFDVCLKNAYGNNPFYANAKPDAQRAQNCIEIELNYDRDYYTYFDWRIIDMRRAHIALHILGIFFATVTFIYLVIAVLRTCCKPRLKTLRCHLYVAGSLVFVGVSFYFCAFLTFHNLMDKEKLAGARYPTRLVTVMNLTTTYYRNNTDVRYSSMYACAWTSLLCELVAVFLFYIPGMCCTYSMDYDDASVTTLPLADTSRKAPQIQTRHTNESSFVAKSQNKPPYSDLELRRSNLIEVSPPAPEEQARDNDPTVTGTFVPMSRY